MVLPLFLLIGSTWLAEQFGIAPGGNAPGEWWQFALWWVSSRTKVWMIMLGENFIAPGEWILEQAWQDMKIEQSFLAVGFSYVVWITVFSEGLKTFQLWDWFRKRWAGFGFAALWVGFRDWFEEVTAFGKGPVSKWATLSDMKANRWGIGDVFLGRPWTSFWRRNWPVGISTEKHMVTIAGTGSGKSTAGLIPNLCLHPGSLLCIDPKGELSRITSWSRIKRHKQDCFVLDPFGVSGTAAKQRASYNPFTEMRAVAKDNPDLIVSYAYRIAEALVKVQPNKDSYWDDAAKTLIGGLVLYIFVYWKEKDQTLMTLRELLTEGRVELFNSAAAQGLIDPKEENPFDFLILHMKSCRAGPHGEAIARSASSIAMMPDPQRGSVITNAQQHTAFLDNPLMQQVLGNSDFKLSDLKNGRTSVYLCLPVTAVTGPEGRWLRLFVLLFIEVMMKNPEKAPNPPVLLAIDEFPSLGRLDGIETIAPMMRSYGVRFWAVGQDISQFKDVYPATWTGIIGGAEAVQFMGITHPPTVDFIADLLGSHQVYSGMGNELRINTHPLMDRDQVSRFLAKDRKNQIIWFGSRRPMKLKICPYFEYMPPWYYQPDPRYKEGWLRRFWRQVGIRLNF